MTEKECINRLRTGNYRGEYGFDMQILVDTAGYAGEMMRDGRLLLKEQEAVEPMTDNEGGYWCKSCYEDIVWHQKYCSNCGRKVKWDG